MSLNIQSILKAPEPLPREINHSDVFESLTRVDNIFDKIIGLENIKQIFLASIYAKEPVHLMLVGKPGCGKTMFLEGVLECFREWSLFIDSTISSGIGLVEGVFDMKHRLRFLLVDEIEKFSKSSRKTLLNLLATGILSRSLRDERRMISGLKVWCFSTCNSIDTIRRDMPELLDRVIILEIPDLTYERYLFLVGKRLLREQDIDSETIGEYIAERVYNEFGHKTNIRLAIKIARLSHSQALSTNTPLTKNTIDMVVQWLKSSTL